ncbi:MAG: hypothetical protein A2X55_08385 [Nitrospirae bacterium GWB2_47_37]|nr:MAG: hypothetical protein A2Z82_07480 [Nitrospirae bacterium GWA2_46_11]OGW24954.1 MAG: hypothetical protein A2X55_08385 [Nitrospirae bacterium GWB2_47_37]HAK88224.1 hypothetical protein [Nitrospiraceae bacterium]
MSLAVDNPILNNPIRIDTKLLGEAESEDGTQTKLEVAQGLRLRVATVGKTEWAGQGEPRSMDKILNGLFK